VLTLSRTFALGGLVRIRVFVLLIQTATPGLVAIFALLIIASGRIFIHAVIPLIFTFFLRIRRTALAMLVLLGRLMLLGSHITPLVEVRRTLLGVSVALWIQILVHPVAGALILILLALVAFFTIILPTILIFRFHIVLLCLFMRADSFSRFFR
jgi:hypothetical protein